MNRIEYILNVLNAINDNLSNGTHTSIFLTIGVSSVISIMAVALPLLLNTITNLDHRYRSTYVVDVFKGRRSVVWFLTSLIISFVFIVIWCISYFKIPILQSVFNICLVLSALHLIGATLYLFYDVYNFSIPDRLLNIIKNLINNSYIPTGYYNREPSPEEWKQIGDFDELTYKYFGVLACLYIDSVAKGDTQAKKILEYWELITKPRVVKDQEKQELQTIFYPNCFYHFIHEVEKWIFEHGDKKSRHKDIVLLTGKLLNAHNREIHAKTAYNYSFETLDSVWKSLRDIIDNGYDEMFKYYWSIINNAFIRHSSIGVNSPNLQADIEYSQSLFAKRAFLYGSYLLQNKRYHLLQYALEYSQSMPFSRPMLPNTIDEVFDSYIFWRQWNNDLEKSTYLHLNDDISTTSIYYTTQSLTDFANFMLHVICSENEHEQEKLEHGNIYVYAYPQKDFTDYASQLICSLTEQTYEWEDEFDMEPIVLTQEQCNHIWKQWQATFEEDQKNYIKERPISSATRDLLFQKITEKANAFWKNFLKEWPNISDPSKQHYTNSEPMVLSVDKKYLLPESAGVSDTSSRMERIANSYPYNVVAFFRNFLIRMTSSYSFSIYPDEFTWTNIVKQVKAEHPLYSTAAISNMSKEKALGTMGNLLRKNIIEQSKGVSVFSHQTALINFIPTLRDLLGIRNDARYYCGMPIIDALGAYSGKENKRFNKYIYNSVFIVNISDLPYVYFDEGLVADSGYKVLEQRRPLVAGISEDEDKLLVNIKIFAPFVMAVNNHKRYKQISIRFKQVDSIIS